MQWIDHAFIQNKNVEGLVWNKCMSILSSSVVAFAKHVRHCTFEYDAPRKRSDEAAIGETRAPKNQKNLYRQVSDT